MSTTSDEFDFPEFTEEELSQIDVVADAALAESPAGSPEVSEHAPTMESPHSRRSSVYSLLELTEEELGLLDESVARFDLNNGIRSPPTISAEITTSPRTTVQHVEISIESPAASNLAGSQDPAFGCNLDPNPMSLYSRFRSMRNALSVSDLVGPAWCELQFDYGLRGGRHLPASQRPAVIKSRAGKTISVQKDVAAKNDAVKEKGNVVHKQLEQEIRPTEIQVTTSTPEDKWGLKLLDMLSNVRILLQEGRCREMPVMGFVHGHFISGIIDEIIYTRPSSIPPIVLGQSTKNNGPPPRLSQTIHILDNKTRGFRSVPKPRDSYQSRLQLMLYKRLFDGLLGFPVPTTTSISRHFSFSEIWEHQSVNPLEHFSPVFLKESALLVLGNQLGSVVSEAMCLRDLELAWERALEELTGGQRDEDGDGPVSRSLKLVYRLRDRAAGYKKQTANPNLQHAIRESIKTYKAETGQDVTISRTTSTLSRINDFQDPSQNANDENIIGSVEFDHDDAILDQHLINVLDFWHDRRPPKGVALEDTGRCTYCEFHSGCEWLEAKAAQFVSRKRR